MDWWDGIDSNPVNFRTSGKREVFRILLPDRFDELVEVRGSYWLEGGKVYNLRYYPDDVWFEEDIISQVLGGSVDGY